MSIFFGRAKRAAEEAAAETARKRTKLLTNLDPRSRLNARRDNFVTLMNTALSLRQAKGGAPHPKTLSTQRTHVTPRKTGSASRLNMPSPTSVSPVHTRTKPAVDYSILSNILQHLDEPADLKVAINSSPTLLAAFLSDRAKVLTSVISNAIKPNAVSATLGLFYCPRFAAYDEKRILPVGSSRLPSPPTSPASPGRPICKWQHKVDKFLRRFKTQDFKMPTEYEDLVLLYRIYHRNAFLIPALATSVLSPDDTPKLMDPNARLSLAKHNLTPREVGRFQRAICHYAIHCALLDPRASQAGAYLKDANLSLPRYEAEELMHVRTFAQKQYFLAFGELEQTFSKYVLKNTSKDTAQPEVPRYTAQQLVAETWEAFPYLEHFFKHYDDDTDEQCRPQHTQHYVQSLTDLGPDFLRNFLRINTTKRNDLILETMYPVLSLRARKQTVDIRDADAPTNHKDDPLRTPNPAWRILHRGSGTGSWPSHREALRRFGWVFWDGARLRTMGLDSREHILDAARATRTVVFKAKRSTDIVGLMEAKFRRLFWARRVKKEWAANEVVSEREQKLVLGWLGQIQTRAPVSVDQWEIDLMERRSR